MESAIKYGAEVATACDPLAAAIALGGKIGAEIWEKINRMLKSANLSLLSSSSSSSFYLQN